MTVSESYEVVTKGGRVMFTFDDKAAAIAFAQERSRICEGIRVERVIRREERIVVQHENRLRVVGGAR
jgi:hypothetical protein